MRWWPLRSSQENEKLFAFLDDIYVVCDPDRVGDVHQLLQRELWVHARISLHLGKTQVWNRTGECPPACEEMQRAALQVDPEARVWKGDVSRPRSEQGLKILGTPVGQPEYVTTKLDQLIAKHRVLLERIPAVNDLQSGWLLLTFYAATRANFTLRNAARVGPPVCCLACQCVAVFLQSAGREPRPDPSQCRANGTVAARSWRVGTEERRTHVARCTLGKLG